MTLGNHERIILGQDILGSILINIRAVLRSTSKLWWAKTKIIIALGNQQRGLLLGLLYGLVQGFQKGPFKGSFKGFL